MTESLYKQFKRMSMLEEETAFEEVIQRLIRWKWPNSSIFANSFREAYMACPRH